MRVGRRCVPRCPADPAKLENMCVIAIARTDDFCPYSSSRQLSIIEQHSAISSSAIVSGGDMRKAVSQ